MAAIRAFTSASTPQHTAMDEERRVTTDADYYEEHAESVELWSPGNPLFKGPEVTTTTEEFGAEGRLGTLLDQSP